MAYAIIATWTAKPGEGEHIARVLQELAPGIRSEPKVLVFHAQQSLDDPDTFVMYEQYTDASGYEDHKATEAFKTRVVGDLLPRLADRSVQSLLTLD